MLLRFTKMHGLGKDFMVIDMVTQHAPLSPRLIRQWSDRHLGIGFDRLLIVEPPGHPDVDFRYRIFNVDGSEVEQCDDAVRCFARFVQDKRLTAKSLLEVETATGRVTVHIRQPAGTLKIERTDNGQPVMMTGPASRVYEGQIRV